MENNSGMGFTPYPVGKCVMCDREEHYFTIARDCKGRILCHYCYNMVMETIGNGIFALEEILPYLPTLEGGVLLRRLKEQDRQKQGQ